MNATVNVVETGQTRNSMVIKLKKWLKKLDKTFTSMESRFYTLNMKQNQHVET